MKAQFPEFVRKQVDTEADCPLSNNRAAKLMSELVCVLSQLREFEHLDPESAPISPRDPAFFIEPAA
jgi:hypothetical protein